MELPPRVPVQEGQLILPHWGLHYLTEKSSVAFIRICLGAGEEDVLAEVTQPLQGHRVVEAADAHVERGGAGRPRAASAVFARRAHEKQPNSIDQLDEPEVNQSIVLHAHNHTCFFWALILCTTHL